MKKRIMSTIANFTTAGLLLFTVATTRAQSSENTAIGKNTTVNYLGVDDDVILFRVLVNNPNGNKFRIIVADDDGHKIFNEVYNDKRFEKRFRVPVTETGKLSFIIKNFMETSSDVHSFEVTSQLTETGDVISVK